MYFYPYINYFLTRSPRPLYRITINRATRKLTLYKNGNLYKTYLIAVGKGSTPTPSGNFRIINKQVNPGGPYGARWMGLNSKGIGIHGTNRPGSIGGPVSHGCIRMYNNDIIELFNMIPIGTVVSII